MKLKQFRGIEFELASCTLNQFDGYGITIFRIGWSWANGITWSDGATLFYINWQKHFEYRGEEWTLTASFFFKRFKLYTWVIVPRQKYCDLHEEYYTETCPYCETESGGGN